MDSILSHTGGVSTEPGTVHIHTYDVGLNSAAHAARSAGAPSIIASFTDVVDVVYDSREYWKAQPG